MHSDTGRLPEGPEIPASGSAEQIRRHLLASRGLCGADSPLIAIIDAHLVVMDSDADAGPPQRPAGRDF